jgi:hypothetical protein
MGTAMVVANVLAENSFAVAFVADDHVVEAITPQISDQTLAHSVRLGGPWRRDQTASPAALHASAEGLPVDRIAVADQEPRILVVPICNGFDKALRRILRAQRGGHADVQDLPAGQVDNNEAVQDLEPKCDDGEEIARPRLMEMVADKR